MKLKSVALVGAGIALGCGAAAVSPMVQSHAQARSGWGCYEVDEMPDMEKAAFNGDDVRSGMNQIAPNTPSGTVIAVAGKRGASLVCVKR